MQICKIQACHEQSGKKLGLSTGTMNLRKEIPQTEPALISIHTVRSQMFPLEQHKLIHALIGKETVFENKIQIHFKSMGFSDCAKKPGSDGR